MARQWSPACPWGVLGFFVMADIYMENVGIDLGINKKTGSQTTREV
jgi:hypothetical protein